MGHARYLVAFLYFAFSFGTTHAETLVLPEKFLQLEVWPHSQVLIDASKRLGILNIQSKLENNQFIKIDQTSINQGISDHSYWLEFELYNPNKQSIDWGIQPDNTYLDYLTLYSSKDNENWQKKASPTIKTFQIEISHIAH